MGTVLANVSYLLFERELVDGIEPFIADEHIVDREIELTGIDGSVKHVSWTGDPVEYCIGVQESSWFVAGDVKVIPMTSAPLWRSLIGQSIEFIWHDDDHQILEIRGYGAPVFLSSRERDCWYADTITISRLQPVVPSNKSMKRTRER
jgi:hypothetical protein